MAGVDAQIREALRSDLRKPCYPRRASIPASEEPGSHRDSVWLRRDGRAFASWQIFRTSKTTRQLGGWGPWEYWSQPVLFRVFCQSCCQGGPRHQSHGISTSRLLALLKGLIHLCCHTRNAGRLWNVFFTFATLLGFLPPSSVLECLQHVQHGSEQTEGPHSFERRLLVDVCKCLKPTVNNFHNNQLHLSQNRSSLKLSNSQQTGFHPFRGHMQSVVSFLSGFKPTFGQENMNKMESLWWKSPRIDRNWNDKQSVWKRGSSH